MKSVFTGSFVALILVLGQTAQAAVVQTFPGDSVKAEQLAEALALAETTFKCVDTRNSKPTNYKLSDFVKYGKDDMGGPVLGENVGALVSIHDGSSPLIEIKYALEGADTFRSGRSNMAQTAIYTNNEFTKVQRVIRRVYAHKRLNKGNLAKPNFVNEPQLLYTVDCRL